MNRTWLIARSGEEAILAAHQMKVNGSKSAEAMEAARVREPRDLAIRDGVADINVHGVLTKEPDWFLAWFGGNTAYTDLAGDLARADADPRVSSIRLSVDSPGGEVDGFFEFIDAMRRVQKPIHAVASRALSAAYGIASNADSIEAVSVGSEFGSVGVAVRYYVSDNVVDIASSDAPKKRPDVKTEEGRAMVRQELDQFHELFVGAIAEGRGTTADVVNSRYGNGGVLTAREAFGKGMIDSVADMAPGRGRASAAQATAEGGESERTMKFSQYAEQNPEEAAAAESMFITKERKRCAALLKSAKAAGNIDLALPHIESGASITDDEVQGEFFAARLNQQSVAARQSESDAVPDVAAGEPKDAIELALDAIESGRKDGK